MKNSYLWGQGYLALHINQYLMPTPEDLMATLVGGMKLNLLNAYQQVQLDEESRQYVT